jgi:hypothetical protein
MSGFSNMEFSSFLNFPTQILVGLFITMRSACATYRNILDVTNLTVGAQFMFVSSLPSDISMDPVCVTNCSSQLLARPVPQTSTPGQAVPNTGLNTE